MANNACCDVARSVRVMIGKSKAGKSAGKDIFSYL
jgi:hypothetical protein